MSSSNANALGTALSPGILYAWQRVVQSRGPVSGQRQHVHCRCRRTDRSGDGKAGADDRHVRVERSIRHTLVGRRHLARRCDRHRAGRYGARTVGHDRLRRRRSVERCDPGAVRRPAARRDRFGDIRERQYDVGIERRSRDPYGTTVDGVEWQFSPTTGATAPDLTAPPAKYIGVNGSRVALDKGAKIDLSGGGDLQAVEWVPGTGGTRDVLSQYNVSYANNPPARRYRSIRGDECLCDRAGRAIAGGSLRSGVRAFGAAVGGQFDGQHDGIARSGSSRPDGPGRQGCLSFRGAGAGGRLHWQVRDAARGVSRHARERAG